MVRDKPDRSVHYGLMAGTRLQEIIRSRGLRQAHLARLTQQQPGTISKLVRGARSLDEHWARMFASVLQVPASAFYDPVGTPIPRPKPKIQDYQAARMAAIRRAWWPDPAKAAKALGVSLEKLQAQEGGAEPLDPEYLVALSEKTCSPLSWVRLGRIEGLDPRALIMIALDSPELVPAASGGLAILLEGQGDEPGTPVRSLSVTYRDC